MKKKLIAATLGLALVFALAACGSSSASSGSDQASAASDESGEILIAAAASLENCYEDQLIPMFNDKYPNITVTATYGGSGALQEQIENGLEADVFMSAATKQMNALVDEGLIDSDSVVELLENKLVLIKAAGIETTVTGYDNILEASSIAIGDPASVPAGQYAEEVFTYLGIWDDVSAVASLGSDVTKVALWVESGEAEVGVVYATDAMSYDDVEIIAEAPEGSLSSPVIYPVGKVSATANSDAADLFIEFLQSDEAKAVFEEYGFTINQVVYKSENKGLVD